MGLQRYELPADILADLRMDVDTLVAGMVHDVVEDTEYELEDIRQRFGKDVAHMVDGVTKISGIRTIRPFLPEQIPENHNRIINGSLKDTSGLKGFRKGSGARPCLGCRGGVSSDGH